MPNQSMTCPMTYAQVVEVYFMEHRAKLIDVAAFLDRLERAQPGPENDFRVEALLSSLDILRDGKPQRVKRILEHFSDHTTDPVDTAPMQGAIGAVPLDSNTAETTS